MAGYSNKTWTCPFFTWDERLAVHCEGGHIIFRDREEAVEYINRHCGCMDGWKDCTLARSKLRFYERTDDT